MIMKKRFLFVMLLMVAAVFAIFAQDPEVPVEPGFNWWLIISGAMAVITTIFGAAAAKFKKKLKAIVVMLKEGLDVIFILVDALDDNNVNPEEVAALKVAIAEFKTAWKKIWNKV